MRMSRKATWSSAPWFWMPMWPSRRLRAGSVLVKSLIRTPLSQTRRRSPSTRISYVFHSPGGFSARSRFFRSAERKPYTAPVVRSGVSVASIWIS